MRGHLFILTGPSGVGKTTVATLVLEAEQNLKRVVTYTTRQPRGDEVPGKDYHFVSEETFRRMIDEDAFFEWAQVYQNRYGETKKDVEDLLSQGSDVLLVVDPQGAKTLTQKNIGATSIFIDTSDRQLKDRLRKRGLDSEEAMQKRMQDIAFDRTHAQFCTNIIQNEEGRLPDTIAAIRRILTQVRS